MAELTDDFSEAGSGWLRCLDARFKMIFLAILSLVSVHTKLSGLLLLVLIQVVLFVSSNISIKNAAKDFRFFFIFLFFVFIFQTGSTQGEELFQVNWYFLTLAVTKDGVLAGLMVCLRLLVVVMLGYLFIQSTTSSHVRAAVAWFLRPVPLVPEKRVATMLSLLMRFLPLMVQEARETINAQRARCVENRRNPVYRFVKLSVPMLRRVFLRADELVLAMEARGYNEEGTLRHLTANRLDWVILAVVMLLSLFLIIFDV